jgi:hypothetical protein
VWISGVGEAVRAGGEGQLHELWVEVVVTASGCIPRAQLAMCATLAASASTALPASAPQHRSTSSTAHLVVHGP